MTTVIFEDNISIVWEYEMMFEELGIEVLGVYKSWSEGQEHLKRLHPDFIIIDIFLKNGENGLDLLQTMQKRFIPFIVCTAYPKEKYLDKALELGASAFFSKPLDKPAFKFKIKALCQEIQNNYNNKSYLIIKDGRSIFRVPQSEITYLEIEGNYASIHLKGGSKHVIKKSLKNLKETLGLNSFFQIHRSTIVNIDYISNYNSAKKMVVLKDGTGLPIGNHFKEELLLRIKN